jgi:UDP-GlcNAc:undecaprenyl-phosphate GlcNAc-1-phosphate transferase
MIVTFITNCLLIYLAPHLRLIDEPHTDRKQHQESTPVIGGIGIVAGMLSLYFTMPDLFEKHWVVFACMVVLMFVGIADDLKHIHSALRMFIQIGVGVAIHFEGNLPFLSVGDIWFIGDLGLGPYALTFTCIAVVGGVNSINMMDGLDGLCGLIVSATLILFAALAWQTGASDAFQLSAVLLALAVTFLLFNYRFPWNPRARVFLGDSGAYVLGFMIAVLFLLGSQGIYKGQPQVLDPITALWLLFIPLIDIAHVIWTRSRAGRWPVSDDRSHIHHLLIDRGLSVTRVVNSLFLGALLLGGSGILLQYLQVGQSWSYVVFMTCCVIYFIVTNRMARQRPPEAD